jgi:hypothetical protein
MYADDNVFLSSSSVGLQEKIDMLEKFCQEWCLTVNLTKTKILIFNKAGRHLKHNFTYNGKTVECVAKCKYLGITFCSSGSFSHVQNQLYQGLKAYFILYKDFICNGPSPKVSLHIFDHTILPTLLYGCEIWGYFNPLSNRLKQQNNLSMDNIYNRLQSEVLHVKLCKYVLGCGKKSSSFAALSELGRLPTHFNIVKAMIKFWHRLQNLDNQFPILKDAYKTSIELHIDKLPSWYGSMNVIDKLIFDITSLSTNSFKKTRNVLTKDHYINLWQNPKILMSEGKLCTYLKVKHNFGFENYLTIIKIFEQRKIFTRFRISAHRLRIELGRCQGTLRQDRVCLHCSSGEVEDEIHYLLNCEKFKDERSNLICSISLGCPNFIQLQNMEKFIWMMNSEDHEIFIKKRYLITKHENPD